jgi:hypothetical protein
MGHAEVAELTKKSWVQPVREASIFISLVAVACSVVYFSPMGTALTRFLNGRRDGLYSTLAGLEGTILGFVLAALTIVLGYSQSPRFEIIRSSRHWGSIFGIYISGIRWTAISTVFAIIGLVLDRDASPNRPVIVLSAASISFSIYYIGKVLWVTEQVVKVVISEKSRNPGE